MYKCNILLISMGKPPVTHIQYSYSIHIVGVYEQYFINIINMLYHIMCFLQFIANDVEMIRKIEI